MEEDQLLTEQVSYYRARASEYDEWFLRQGRYDRGPEHRAAWFREVAIVETALRETVRENDVLELACGTGLWTQHLAKDNTRVVAIDASPEAIAINRGRIQSNNVEYTVADIFSWVPTRTFDAVFFGFWLSHVPPGQFDAFWTMVRTALKPGGSAFFVDSLRDQSSTARDHEWLEDSGVVRRRLNDGRAFQIVKVFHDPAVLERRLFEAGWRGWVRSTGRFFLYGSMTQLHSAG
jgi:2-polyprenyl-3-methyl-5-hydroxy-6-metoxy-1,4-benzoquinol methylase